MSAASSSTPTSTAKRGASWTRQPKAALVFHWKSLNRQVRVRGPVEHVTDAEADAYFATRPKQAQIGAWASKQSSPLESRLAFEKAVALYAREIRASAACRARRTGPATASCRCSIEFWHDRPFRLHDRIEFRRAALGAPWSKTRLYP